MVYYNIERDAEEVYAMKLYLEQIGLHSNAKGFDYYFKGLWPNMKAALKE